MAVIREQRVDHLALHPHVGEQAPELMALLGVEAERHPTASPERRRHDPHDGARSLSARSRIDHPDQKLAGLADGRHANARAH
jgi:hypothetical protein